jgi:drug/metabolite transporter (DMT)-like permease
VQDYSHLFSWGAGELMALASSFFLALSFVLRKKQNNTLNNQEMSILMFFISAVLLIVTSTLLGEQLPPISTWTTPLFLIVVGAGLNNIAYMFLTNYGFQKIEAILANNLLILTPVFATLLGFIFYKEFPSMKEWIGGALILVSAYLMNRVTT